MKIEYSPSWLPPLAPDPAGPLRTRLVSQSTVSVKVTLCVTPAEPTVTGIE